MPNTSAQFTTLDYLVRQAILDVGDATEHNYVCYLSWAYKALREINKDMNGNIQGAVMTVTANKTAVVPTDFVDWVRVGLLKENKVYFIDNQDCALTKEMNLARTDVDDDAVEWGSCCSEGANNWFKFYRIEGLFEFSELLETDQEIYLEYLASEYKDSNGNTLVHIYAEEFVIAYIHWERTKHARNIGLGERQMKEREVIKTRRLLRGRLNNVTPEQIGAMRSRWAMMRFLSFTGLDINWAELS
ncbi:MAG: hypothetical protein ACRC78_21660 [Planktothrix sp.]